MGTRFRAVPKDVNAQTKSSTPISLIDVQVIVAKLLTGYPHRRIIRFAKNYNIQERVSGGINDN